MNRHFWAGKRVLVTGNTGFKGSWLTYWLACLGARVSGLALAPESQPSLYHAAKLDADVETFVADVRDEHLVASVVKSTRPEIVFHLAAQPLVRASYEQPTYTYAVNAMGTANVLEALRSSESARAVVCVTTDKCYENREWAWPYRETDGLGGRDPYSSSKACAEIITAAYRRSFFVNEPNVGVATARGGNVIGGGDWSPDRIIPDLVRAFAAGKPAIVRSPNAVRPWQFVLDALHGYLILAEKLHAEPIRFSEAWNFGPDASGECCVSTIADQLKAAWGQGADWQQSTSSGAPHEAHLLALDSSKARRELGWRDLLPIDATVTRLARWYASYNNGIDAKKLMSDDIAHFERLMESAA